MRITIDLSRRETHGNHQLGDLGAALGSRPDAMNAQRLLDDRAGGHAWIERRVGVLENDLDRTLGVHRLAAKPDGARIRWVKSRQDAAQRGLAAAAFADQRQGLAGLDREVDPVDRVYRALAPSEQALAAHRKMFDHVAGFEQRLGHDASAA